jgi:hypothetical protein
MVLHRDICRLHVLAAAITLNLRLRSLSVHPVYIRLAGLAGAVYRPLCCALCYLSVVTSRFQLPFQHQSSCVVCLAQWCCVPTYTESGSVRFEVDIIWRVSDRFAGKCDGKRPL